MTDLATVLQVEPITEFEIKRSEGISEKMKKKCLVLLVGFNTMYCEAFDKITEGIEAFQLKEGQKVMVQYEIKVTQVKAKTDGSVFYKNNIKITNLNTF